MTFCNALQTVDLQIDSASAALYASPVATFGENLKARREAVGLPQEALAKLLGHTRPSTVQAWEKNRRRPKPANVRKLADQLRCSPAELLEGVEGDYDGLRGDTTQDRHVTGAALTRNEAKAVRILQSVALAEQHDALVAFAVIARRYRLRRPRGSSAHSAPPLRAGGRAGHRKSRNE